MDPRQAQASLDEVRTREQQIADVVARDGSPWWYVGGIAAAFLAVAVSSDLDDLWGGWIGPVLDYAVPAVGIGGIGGLAMALHRSMGVRPRRCSGRVLRGMVWLAVAFLVVYIGLGTALRLAEVSWDSTISGIAATLVFLGGSLALRRTALAESAPPRVD